MGQRQSLAESRPIPGNSRWCSAWLNPREDGSVLSYTSGQQAEVVVFEVLRLCQGSMEVCVYQVKSRFCLYQVTSKILFIPGHFQDSVYTRSLPRFCLYQVTSKILFIPGGVLSLIPASMGRRALGRPIHACRAIVTAFARLPSRSASPGRWRSLGQAGITNLHDCRRLGLTT